MKVFLGWSGDLSRRVALALRDWLPQVNNFIKPFMSEEDIEKGTRWSVELAKELDESSFGIVCLTPDNLHKPWILFESGALSKTFETSRLAPFLLGVKPSEVSAPLTHFQAVKYNEEDVKKLVFSINNGLAENRLEEKILDKSYEKWWPELEEKLNPFLAEAKEINPKGKDTEADGHEADAPADVSEKILSLLWDVRNRLDDLKAPIADYPSIVSDPAVFEYIGPLDVDALSKRFDKLVDEGAPRASFLELFDLVTSCQNTYLLSPDSKGKSIRIGHLEMLHREIRSYLRENLLSS